MQLGTSETRFDRLHVPMGAFPFRHLLPKGSLVIKDVVWKVIIFVSKLKIHAKIQCIIIIFVREKFLSKCVLLHSIFL